MLKSPSYSLGGPVSLHPSILPTLVKKARVPRARQLVVPVIALWAVEKQRPPSHSSTNHISSWPQTACEHRRFTTKLENQNKSSFWLCSIKANQNKIWSKHEGLIWNKNLFFTLTGQSWIKISLVFIGRNLTSRQKQRVKILREKEELESCWTTNSTFW